AYNADDQVTGITRSDANLTASIWKNVGGTWTQLTAAPVAGSSGTLRLDVVGSSLTLLLNGTPVGSTTDGSVSGAGSVGVRGSASPAWDNFSASPLQASLPFSDDFNRANSGTPGSSYTVTGGSLAVTSNLLNASSFGEAGVTTAPAADVSVQADVWLGTSATPWVGLVARYGGSGDSNQYWGAVGAGVGGVYYAWIYKNVAGTWTLLASATFGSGGL